MWPANSSSRAKGQVLIELTNLEPNIVANSYFANCLARKFDSRIVAYSEKRKIDRRLKALYESINATFLNLCLTSRQLRELEIIKKQVVSSIKNKHDVYNLRVRDIWIGDLLYDYHLKINAVPTVNPEEPAFEKSLNEALIHLIFWVDYFEKHFVTAVNVSHCCYLMAIPVRVAISKGVPAYHCNAHGIYRMNEEQLSAYGDIFDFPAQFALLDEDEKREGLRVARDRIERRFSGEIGVDMLYSTKSAFASARIGRVLSSSNKIKILIAMHCFFDSPNGLGRNLFIDFFEWLRFLGEISNKTNYEWYIKTHPDSLPGNIPLLEEFVRKYSKFKLLPKETSHFQLIEEGIDVGLTVYGTMGFEYAALGKTVITASPVNGHVAYNFNIHPKTVEEYENILMNLADVNLEINKEEVYEYYYMRFVRINMENWLLDDYEGFLEKIGGGTIGYKKQFSSLSYKYFLEHFDKQKHDERLKLLENFIDSGDYAMGNQHYQFSQAERRIA
jgi:hypothetical protein